MTPYRRVNLFGRPGVGKSTVAARIYHEMKVWGMHVELVNEYVKTWAYMGRPIKTFDQVYVFGKQLHSEDRLLLAGIDHIVTDSPLLIQYCYATLDDNPVRPELLGLVRKFDAVYRPLNIMLIRESEHHTHEGRYHDKAASQRCEDIMKQTLQVEYGECQLWDAADVDGIGVYVVSKLQT